MLTGYKYLSRELILPLLLLVFHLPSFAQNKEEILVGYAETYDKLPKLSFDSSSLGEYDKYPAAAVMTHPELKASKTHLIISTKGKQFNLKKYKNHGDKGYSGFEFLGYYPQLKMYALTDNTTAEHLGFGTLVLIDSLTHLQYGLVSIGDGPVELPVPSAGGKYLIYFYNWPYQDNSCFIGLLKINDSANPEKLLAEKASFETKKWAVESVKWLNDTTFFVKAFTVQPHQRNGMRFYQYLKGKIE